MARGRAWLAACAATALLGCAPADEGGADAPAEKPTAQQILERTRAAYARLATYRDRGEVVQQFSHANGRTSTERENFHTAFARPQQLLFDYRGHVARHVVWRSAERARSWSSWDTEIAEHDALSSPLAVLAGVTNLVSVLVPEILVEDGALGVFENATVSGASSVEGEACWDLTVSSPLSTTILSIGQSDYLIRRHFSRKEFTAAELERSHRELQRAIAIDSVRADIAPLMRDMPPPEEFTATDVITYAPEADAPVADEELTFTPPAPVTEIKQAEPASYEGIGASLDPGEHGVVFHRIYRDSPAAAAGLRAGEVIRAVDGESTAEWSTSEAAEHIRGPAGTRVTLTIERDGATREVTIVRARFEARD